MGDGWSFRQMVREQLNIDTDLTLFEKVNSKWITCLNVKQKTMRLPEYSIGENRDALEDGDDLDTTPWA